MDPYPTLPSQAEDDFVTRPAERLYSPLALAKQGRDNLYLSFGGASFASRSAVPSVSRRTALRCTEETLRPFSSRGRRAPHEWMRAEAVSLISLPPLMSRLVSRCSLLTFGCRSRVA